MENYMSDKYDEEIAKLTELCHKQGNNDPIVNHWNQWTPLFQCVGDGNCGCLTQVKKDYKEAATINLTKAIRADPRIPREPEYITIDDLPVFAEWQRRIDKELNRL